MRIYKQTNSRLIHSYLHDDGVKRPKGAEGFALISFVIFAFCTFKYGSPFETVTYPTLDSLLSGSADQVVIPGSTISLLARSFFLICASIFAINDFFRFLDWRDQLLSMPTLNRLSAAIAPIDFVSKPHLRFPVPIELMTNADLSRWCRRYNSIISSDSLRDSIEDRSERISHISGRLCGDIEPRPASFVKKAWYLPTQYELARRGKRGWYFDSPI